MNIKLCFYSIFLFSACGNSFDSPFDKKSDNPQTSINKTDTLSDIVSSPISSDELKFELLTNMEQIVFCLPYPSSYMKEDFEQNDSRAKHVLVCNNKKGKMILQGLWTDLPFEQIYINHHDEIFNDSLNSKMITSFKIGDYYIVSWSDNKKIYYVKKWLTNDKDIVMAYFEYEKSEQKIFDKIITIITSSNPEVCD